MALLAVVSTLVVGGHTDCQTAACNERVAGRHCRTGAIVACIERGALHWDVSPAMLRRKARCESRMRPWARNPSGASGLFQFLPSTWRSTPYRWRSVWSAERTFLDG